MPILTHTETLLIGAIVAPALFAASILLTGARGRQILGGVAGAAAYGIATFTWDHVAAMAGWWHYRLGSGVAVPHGSSGARSPGMSHPAPWGYTPPGRGSSYRPGPGARRPGHDNGFHQGGGPLISPGPA